MIYGPEQGNLLRIPAKQEKRGDMGQSVVRQN